MNSIYKQARFPHRQNRTFWRTIVNKYAIHYLSYIVVDPSDGCFSLTQGRKDHPREAIGPS